MEQDKRFYRNRKRELKRAGGKRRRRHLQRDLRDNPEEAHQSEFRFGRDSSAALNGLDQDRTRKRPGDAEEGTRDEG